LYTRWKKGKAEMGVKKDLNNATFAQLGVAKKAGISAPTEGVADRESLITSTLAW
jgi:hypothetical protein